MTRYEEQLLAAFHDAAMFLKERVEKDGWHWSSNYLREHVRCATGMRFTNSISPVMLRELLRIYPKLTPYIEIGKLKGDDESALRL